MWSVLVYEYLVPSAQYLAVSSLLGPVAREHPRLQFVICFVNIKY